MCMRIGFVTLITFIICGCSTYKNKNTVVRNDTINNLNIGFGSPISEFEVLVPENYNHFTQLDSFVHRHHHEWEIKWWISDKNFAGASNKLVPGRSYKVRIFPILSKVTPSDCLEFLKKEKAILVNAQGLTLAWSLHKEKFPKDKWILSWDNLESLPKAPDLKYDEYNMPMIGLRSDGVWQLNLYALQPLSAMYVIICFTEKDETTR